MAKKKSRPSSPGGHRQNFVNQSGIEYKNYKHSNVLQENLDRQRRQTRDYRQIANEQLSFAEDLRRFSPDRKKFHNIDGSIAETTYKPVPVQKKSTLHKLVLFGATCLVSFTLGVLASASVEVYANKYYSLIKFW